ncbi:hypothetical protein FKX85_08235 [Echinicola soli]|uniref:Uncharacterized protein n=1 Tax=Echinicola soli TaxID=2591634 RepID=A0A514CGS0_9BACT|nr:hypothetical protein [Echinicola soli]QDH79025.1 hypothetical protein FKX85_08235 [Echinicola soli]
MNKVYGRNSEPGPNILVTFTEDFHIGDKGIFFLQSDNSIHECDMDGNLVAKHKINSSEEGNAVSMCRFTDHEIVLLWYDTYKNSQYAIVLFNIKKGTSKTIFKKKLEYPSYKTQMEVHHGKVYLFEDISDSVVVIDKKGKKMESVKLPKSPWKNYEVHNRAEDKDISFYRSLSKIEKAKYINDSFGDVTITDNGHIYLLHHLYQRDSISFPFKELVSVFLPDKTLRDVEFDHHILNLDNHGNYFSIVRHEEKSFLKISPILIK